jgi:hypothetical protein
MAHLLQHEPRVEEVGGQLRVGLDAAHEMRAGSGEALHQHLELPLEPLRHRHLGGAARAPVSVRIGTNNTNINATSWFTFGYANATNSNDNVYLGFRSGFGSANCRGNAFIGT